MDKLTNRMKDDWFSLREFVGQPVAMAIFAGSLVIAIAIGATTMS